MWKDCFTKNHVLCKIIMWDIYFRVIGNRYDEVHRKVTSLRKEEDSSKNHNLSAKRKNT
jgi:hypothetical protein